MDKKVEVEVEVETETSIDLVSLVDSEGYIEVAIVNGNAARALNAKTGDIVEVLSKPA